MTKRAGLQCVDKQGKVLAEVILSGELKDGIFFLDQEALETLERDMPPPPIPNRAARRIAGSEKRRPSLKIVK